MVDSATGGSSPDGLFLSGVILMISFVACSQARYASGFAGDVGVLTSQKLALLAAASLSVGALHLLPLFVDTASACFLSAWVHAILILFLSFLPMTARLVSSEKKPTSMGVAALPLAGIALAVSTAAIFWELGFVFSGAAPAWLERTLWLGIAGAFLLSAWRFFSDYRERYFLDDAWLAAHALTAALGAVAGAADATISTRHFFLGISFVLVTPALFRDRQLRDREIDLLIKSRTTRLTRANEELRQFASVASHDLKEPLRTVILYLQLLRRSSGATLPSESLEYLGVATESAKRMASLIDGLLEYSRIDNRESPSAPESIDLSALVREVTKSLDGAIRETGTSVEIGELPSIVGVKSQLTQLFQNLIANAIKFRRRDETPVIRIDVEASAQEWTIAVRDNGIGFSQEHAARIFTMFQRLHAREQYEGAGIGLAICKKIVEAHGGRIWAESSQGNGSTFHFTLPKQAPSTEN